MSLSTIKSEIQRFLRSSTPETLCIAGKWGAGKTYTWNYLLEECASRGNLVALEKYAYVSLFGISSIDELNISLFESTIPLQRTPNRKEFLKSLDFAEKNWRSIAGKLRFVRGSNEIASFIAYSQVANTIVCIDDLERLSAEKLKLDILGLMFSLKEKYNCKIVFLLNDEKLGDEKSSFEEYLEKTVDVYLNFHISSDEACLIALNPGDRFYDIVRTDCEKLNIVNI
jgi:Cdc6-like AAA superfamily ATPase